MDPRALMQAALTKACEGMARGESPFGCAIALDGQLVAAHNTVLSDGDITAHAEVNAIRAACRQWGRLHLDQAAVATTCEPCPMCMAALHWARVGTVYFGAEIADAERAGFNELRLPAADLVRLGASPIELAPGILTEACRALFEQWRGQPNRRTY